MSTKVAFVAYPVRDIAASRAFYDLVLRTSGLEMNGDWIEYDLSGTTFVITKADAIDADVNEFPSGTRT